MADTSDPTLAQMLLNKDVMGIILIYIPRY